MDPIVDASETPLDTSVEISLQLLSREAIQKRFFAKKLTVEF